MGRPVGTSTSTSARMMALVGERHPPPGFPAVHGANVYPQGRLELHHLLDSSSFRVVDAWLHELDHVPEYLGPPALVGGLLHLDEEGDALAYFLQEGTDGGVPADPDRNPPLNREPLDTFSGMGGRTPP